VQELRRRAQASGYLPEQAIMQQEGANLAIYPAQPYVYVPYYDPLLVYGPWWWPGYAPVYWRPWRPAPVFVSATFFFGAIDWHRRHVAVVRQPPFAPPHQIAVTPGRWRHAEPRRQPMVRPQPTFGVSAPRTQAPPQPSFGVRPPRTHSSADSAPVVLHNHVQQARVARPIAPAVSVQPRAERPEWRHERREIRQERREWRPGQRVQPGVAQRGNPAGFAPRGEERRGAARQGQQWGRERR
jgi:hypothetical protein